MPGGIEGGGEGEVESEGGRWGGGLEGGGCGGVGVVWEGRMLRRLRRGSGLRRGCGCGGGRGGGGLGRGGEFIQAHIKNQ